jgi:tRNA pseudouridine55 synthase
MRLLVVCGRGTYVRALARDIGRAAGSAAHIAGLRRLAVGALRAEEARPVEDLRKDGRDAALAALRPADDGILGLDHRYRTAPAAELLAEWGSASGMAGTAG